MKDKMLSATIKLALCPGKCDGSEICKVCRHYGQINCEEKLKTEVLQLMQEYQAYRQGTKSSTNSLERRVTEIMHEIGIPAHVKGYRYIREAIVLAVNDRAILEAITKSLYPQIAETFQTTPSRVERAIRHAIEVAWDRGDVDVLQSYFGYTVSGLRGKPTNGEFIALITDKICVESDKEVK